MATHLLYCSSNISERKAETKKRIAKRLHEILGEFNRIDASEKVRSSYLKLNEEVSKYNLPDNKSIINQKAIESAVKNQATLEELREKRKQQKKRSLIDDMVAKEQEEKQRNKDTNISSQRMLSVKQRLTTELCQDAQLDEIKKAVMQTKQNSHQILMQTFLQTPSPQAVKHAGKHRKSMTAIDGDMDNFMKAKRDQNFQEYLQDEIAAYHIRGAKRPSSQFNITSPSASQCSSQSIQLPVYPAAVRMKNYLSPQEHDEGINKTKSGITSFNSICQGINQDTTQFSGIFENRGGKQNKLQSPLQQQQPQQSLSSNYDDAIHQQNVIALTSCYDILQKLGKTASSKSTDCPGATYKNKMTLNETRNSNSNQNALSNKNTSPSFVSPSLFSFRELKPKFRYYSALKSYAIKPKRTCASSSPQPFRFHGTPRGVDLKGSSARTMAVNIRKNNIFDKNNNMPWNRFQDIIETHTSQPILRIQAQNYANQIEFH